MMFTKGFLLLTCIFHQFLYVKLFASCIIYVEEPTADFTG